MSRKTGFGWSLSKPSTSDRESFSQQGPGFARIEFFGVQLDEQFAFESYVDDPTTQP